LTELNIWWTTPLTVSPPSIEFSGKPGYQCYMLGGASRHTESQNTGEEEATSSRSTFKVMRSSNIHQIV